jgi:hypothetical protein
VRGLAVQAVYGGTPKADNCAPPRAHPVGIGFRRGARQKKPAPKPAPVQYHDVTAYLSFAAHDMTLPAWLSTSTPEAAERVV